MTFKRQIISLPISIQCAVLRAFIFALLFSMSAPIFAETPTIKRLIEESVSALLNKDANTAIEKLDQVLLLSPEHPEARR